MANATTTDFAARLLKEAEVRLTAPGRETRIDGLRIARTADGYIYLRNGHHRTQRHKIVTETWNPVTRDAALSYLTLMRSRSEGEQRRVWQAVGAVKGVGRQPDDPFDGQD